ncbi:MAG: hypothetical protein GX946_05995 [Oligosphaeraceae bacterium]|nr:hypothetical protein [Oligosphaeraceae bacterium]
MRVQRKIIIAFFALLLLSLAFYLTRLGASKNDKPHSQTEAHASAGGGTENAAVSGEQSSPDLAAKTALAKKNEQAELDELQDLLDDDDKQQESLAKALSLSRSHVVAQQLAAIDALRWLGGKESVRALIQLRKNATPIVAEAAGMALTHLLAESLHSGGLRSIKTEAGASSPDQGKNVDKTAQAEELADDAEMEEEPSGLNIFADVEFDAKLWEEAIIEAPTPAERDELLILLSAHPNTDTVPILLNMLESGNEELHAAALEYLEFVTFGVPISNRQEGEDWLATHGAMENFQKQEE